MQYKLNVNGKPVSVDAEPGTKLLSRCAAARCLGETMPRIRHHSDFVEPSACIHADAQLDHREVDRLYVSCRRKRAGPRKASNDGSPAGSIVARRISRG